MTQEGPALHPRRDLASLSTRGMLVRQARLALEMPSTSSFMHRTCRELIPIAYTVLYLRIVPLFVAGFSPIRGKLCDVETSQTEMITRLGNIDGVRSAVT